LNTASGKFEQDIPLTRTGAWPGKHLRGWVLGVYIDYARVF